MKRVSLLAIVLCLMITTPLLAVTVSETDKYVVIETAGYTVHWNKDAQMGYMQAFVGGSGDMIGEAGRAFYHSSNYAGSWKDWGALLAWEIVEEAPGRVAIKYESKDSGTKEYTSVATYYDNVSYIKHELTITNTGAATPAFASGHEPQFEINVPIEGMETFDDPFPHGVYWTADGTFGATYSPAANSAAAGDWGGQSPGRMELNFDNVGGDIGAGDSVTIVYYAAFGPGGVDEGHNLAEHVQEEPTAVSPTGSLTTTWGNIRVAK